MAQVSKYRYLLNQYPETVQKEQFRIICHISKRTARYLLQSGLVPCVQSGKKTRNYTIKMKDIVRYRSFPLYLSVGYVSRLVLRYNHHYTTEVGTSALGAITRIEHLAERIPGYLKEAQRELEEVQKQLAVAQQQVGQPFIYEDELSEKVAQLTEINTKLEFESLQESEVILDENGQRSDGEEDWDSERVPSCASAEV